MGTGRTNSPNRRPWSGGRGAYTLVILLVLAFLLPTTCLVWFMVQAMRNERLAVRQKVIDVYADMLQVATTDAHSFVEQKYLSIRTIDATSTNILELFPVVVAQYKPDSLILFDVDGRLKYPQSSSTTWEALADLPNSPAYEEGRRLEEIEQDLGRAARVYKQAADEAKDINTRTLALQALARTLLKDKRTTEALEVLTGPLTDVEFASARNTNGRLIQPNTQLLALELLNSEQPDRFHAIEEQFVERLNHYGAPPLPASQRLFLMDAYLRLRPQGEMFPTREAEHIALQQINNEDVDQLLAPANPIRFQRDFWSTPFPILLEDQPMGSAALLYSSNTLVRALRQQLETKLPDSVRLEIFPPNARVPPLTNHATEIGPEDPILIRDLGQALTGWNVALYPTERLSFNAEAGKQATIYLWAGVLSIFSVAGIILVGGRMVFRQARLTRLKNDLTANVTHELKTPISSMRLLVDTLRDNPDGDKTQRVEYLDMIARENARLSRLIDNFLTFSRMERNRRSFEFNHVKISDVINQAVEAGGDKFRQNGCALQIEIESDIAPVNGDTDALVTVLLNLLDNAYKYSGEEKRIGLRAWQDQNAVCIEVQDNGIGIPPRAQRRIFERFYQVDQSLSRTVSGCGLGLSIVDYIVKDHGGRIDVVSEPGRGSSFVVRLPVTDAAANSEER